MPHANARQFCKRRHDTAITGRDKYGRCRQCSRHRDMIRTAARKEKVCEIKAWLSEIKIKSGCVECGYNKAGIALDFDHLPGFKKFKDISNMTQHPTKNAHQEILAEISKCEIVCSNCHRIRTANRAAGAA